MVRQTRQLPYLNFLKTCLNVRFWRCPGTEMSRGRTWFAAGSVMELFVYSYRDRFFYLVSMQRQYLYVHLIKSQACKIQAVTQEASLKLKFIYLYCTRYSKVIIQKLRSEVSLVEQNTIDRECLVYFMQTFFFKNSKKYII